MFATKPNRRSFRFSTCALLVGLALATGCGDEEEKGGPGTPVVESDPAVIGGYLAWERECILWLRGDCKKAESCDIIPADDCWDSDAELRRTCQEMVRGDGCTKAEAQSFADCADLTAGKTCQEFCDTAFCFNFCFYDCEY